MKLNILLVDDDPDDRAIIRDYFEDAPYDVAFEEVDDGDTCLERLAQGNLPDLVLLDLNMPRLGGMATLQEIRARPELEGLHVIILTTSDQDSDIEESFDARANYFMTKPDKPEGFQALIQLVKDFAEAYIWKTPSA